jgi:hypothetical protein
VNDLLRGVSKFNANKTWSLTLGRVSEQGAEEIIWTHEGWNIRRLEKIA